VAADGTRAAGRAIAARWFTDDRAAAPGIIRVFNQALAKLGWTIGRNVRIEYRWGANDADLDRRYAVELAALALLR
jgi:hypothetical protein